MGLRRVDTKLDMKATLRPKLVETPLKHQQPAKVDTIVWHLSSTRHI